VAARNCGEGSVDSLAQVGPRGGTVRCSNAGLPQRAIRASASSAGDTFDDKLSTLRDCVEHLPKAYRESIQLRYGEELQPAALAERTGIALAAVKKRLLRAKTRLLDCIRRKLQVPEVSP
jgi:DNA-directed RNA polymerase specialized sigma24 family protein